MAVDDLFSLTDTPLACGGHPATVLGRDLLPFSIWHLWLLRSYESPYVDGGQVEAQDVATAALFCSCTRQEIGDILSDEKTLVSNIGDLVAKWWSLDEDQRLQAQAILDMYFADSCKTPEFWQDTDRDPVKDRQRCPGEWHLIFTLLQNNICKTEEDAWNYPYSRAVCWVTVAGEKNGSRDYIDQMDREQIEAVNNGNN